MSEHEGLTEKVLTQWAVHAADSFDVARPQTALARLGVALRVHAAGGAAAGRAAPGRKIQGAWDPVKRRIELFCGNERGSDGELVATLGHELFHVLSEARGRVRRSASPGAGPRAQAQAEAAARRFAEAWRKQLGPANVRSCAAALRALVTAG